MEAKRNSRMGTPPMVVLANSVAILFIGEPGGHYKSACLSEVLKNTILSPGFGFPGACG
jgi:hypothetical protein